MVNALTDGGFRMIYLWILDDAIRLRGSLCAHSVDHLWVICGFDGKDPSVPATFHFSAAVMARPSDLERLPTLDSKVVRETVALYTSRLRKGTLLRWRCGSATPGAYGSDP